MYLGKLQQEVGKQVTITDVFNIIHSHGCFFGICHPGGDQVFSNSAPRDLVVVMKVEYLYNPWGHLSGCLLRASFCIPTYLITQDAARFALSRK